MEKIKVGDAINRVQNNENDTEAVKVIIKAIKGLSLERLFETLEAETVHAEYEFNDYIDSNDLELEDTLSDGLRRATALIENILNEAY